MAFTVLRTDGVTDAEFQAYARLLRQTGRDLGRLPRVRDPIGNKRWLAVWNSQEEAQAFAEELNEQTDNVGWQVAPVNTPGSVGPLGPVVFLLLRQSDGLTFSLHVLSLVMIRSAFPGTSSATTYTTTDAASWHDFRKKKGGLAELVREVAPVLTGLSLEQLDEIGYSVVDAHSEKTLVEAPPAEAAQV